MAVSRGKVKWFNDRKGYGFINVPGIKEDIFVHQSAIHMDGYRVLFPGEDVECEIVPVDKGLKAVHVKKIVAAI